MTKQELENWIRRKLGYPMVRVELHTTQIQDCINKARYEYIKWATGEATSEVYFTLALSANVSEYELPAGVVEIISGRDLDTSVHGINTLFSVENYLYNQGAFDFLKNNSTGYNLLDYHMTLEFLDLLDKYTANYYKWRYNKSTNKLKIIPTPSEDSSIGYIIFESYMLEGTDASTKTLSNDIFNYIYKKPWVQDYSLACAKETLGLIRRKFSSFSSIGNQGIQLDGSELISEGREEKTMLEEKLKLEEGSEGWGFIVA